MRRVIAVGIVLLVAFTGIASGFLIVNAINSQCHVAQKQYDVLHNVIVEQNKVQPASPIIIKAFPQFAPFYTPGTPQYKEAKRIADDKRDRALAQQGERPDC